MTAWTPFYPLPPLSLSLHPFPSNLLSFQRFFVRWRQIFKFPAATNDTITNSRRIESNDCKKFKKTGFETILENIFLERIFVLLLSSLSLPPLFVQITRTVGVLCLNRMVIIFTKREEFSVDSKRAGQRISKQLVSLSLGPWVCRADIYEGRSI